MGGAAVPEVAAFDNLRGLPFLPDGRIAGPRCRDERQVRAAADHLPRSVAGGTEMPSTKRIGKLP